MKKGKISRYSLRNLMENAPLDIPNIKIQISSLTLDIIKINYINSV